MQLLHNQLDFTEAVMRQVNLVHPDNADLAFLYGTILTDGKDVYSPDQCTQNMCVFADREVRTRKSLVF